MMKKSIILSLAGTLMLGGIGVSAVGLALGGANAVTVNATGVEVMPFKEMIAEEVYDQHSDNKVYANAGKQLEAFKNLEVAVGTVELNVVEGEKYAIDVQVNPHVRLTYEVEGDTLMVKQKNKGINMGMMNTGKEGTVTIMVPRGTKLNQVAMKLGVGEGLVQGLVMDQLDLTMGAGVVTIEAVKAQKAVLQGGAGEFNVDGLETDTLKIQGGVGSIQIEDLVSNGLEAENGVSEMSISGDITGDIHIKGGMGEINLDLDKSENLYDYDISRGVGSIEINGNRSDGMGNITKSTGAPYHIKIESGVGAVSIDTKH